MNITKETRVVKRFKPFILGKCRCGCNTDIPIRSGHYLKKWAFKHWYKKGEGNSKWNGGIVIDQRGYRKIMNWDHPYHDNKGYVFEHRLVYEEYLTKLNGIKTYLHPSIHIHHNNEDKLDNRIENLSTIILSEHNKIHKKKDMSNRTCLECGINKTRIGSKGYQHWFKWKNGFRCNKCYMREYDSKK